MKPAFFLLLMVSFCNVSTSQILHPSFTYAGLGAYSANHTDVFCFTSNPASLAKIKSLTAGICAERKFLLGELSNYKLAAALPMRSSGFGLQMNYYGFSLYSEALIGFAYARSLGSKMDAGVKFNYNNIRIAGYGSASAVSFEAGTTWHVTEKLHTGFHLNNPIGGMFGTNMHEKLPFIYSAGIGYDASEKFLFSAIIMKEEDQPITVDAGIQYRFMRQILVRTGVSASTSSVWIGTGFFYRSLRIDVVTSYHPQLGITPGLMLVLNAKTPA